MEEASFFRVIGTKERLVDRVVQAIQEMILSHSLSVGTKLPPERELAEQLGVSRTVVREAVHILVTKGLLISRRKIGTLVRSMDQSTISDSLAMLLQSKGFTLQDLHEVRSLLEVEIAGLAAENGSDAQIAQLAEIVNRMESCATDTQKYADTDAEFHHFLTCIAGNSLLVMLQDSISDLLKDVRLSLSAAPNLFVSAMPDHRRILDAVASHNAHKARQAMRVHLKHAREIQEKFLEL